ncbi:MAG: NADH:ubiquinone reductase (Na(+)-transporting) subunit B [Lentisphaerota bacterium]
MKWLLHMMEKSKPLFERGGRLSWMYPLYEATETFLFTPDQVTATGPHIRDALDMKRAMTTVIVALIPCSLFGIFNAGYQYNVVNQVAGATLWTHLYQGLLLVLPIIMTSYVVGGLWEVLFAIVRKHEINEGFLVTGLLFPLTLPPTIPLWQVALGISFGVVIGKEIFGGAGYNILNPALTARCFLYFAYPAQITGDRVWTSVVDTAHTVAGFTGATPLSVAKSVPSGSHIIQVLHEAGYTLKSMVAGLEPGSIGETSLIAVLLGAAILILTGVGSWRIMTGGFLGLIVTESLINLLPAASTHPALSLPFYYEVAMGGVAFGIVFMATDPVSAAATNPGKWIYGALIGFMTVIIRKFNPAYTAGNMLAILFSNIMAPLIDYAVVQVHIRNRARRARKPNYAEG